MKILVVTRWDPEPRRRSEHALYRALRDTDSADVSLWVLESRGWPSSSSFHGYDAVVVAAKFLDLVSMETMDWGSFRGLRVQYEPDACQNYSYMGSRDLRGAFAHEYLRHGFDLLITTGREVARRLTDDRIEAAWVPKGFDDSLFFNRGLQRRGICTYGSMYRSRAAMAKVLRRSGAVVDHVRAPYPLLAERLNQYRACIVCNMEGTVRLGKLGRALNRVWPGVLVSVRPGVEPMIKNFEASACGCATFMDYQAELLDLGFVDGETALLYHDFDELVERVRATSAGDLEVIGSRAAALCANRHTWDQRAEQLLAVISSRVASAS